MSEITQAAWIWGVSMSVGTIALGVICAILILCPSKWDPAIRLKEKKRQNREN
jgi:hypothetical protein